MSTATTLLPTPVPIAAAEIPNDWVRISIPDPHLVMFFPPGWASMTPAESRKQLEVQLPKATGDVATLYGWALEQIDAGKLRIIAFGPASIANVTTSFSILVERVDASLAAAAERWIAETKAHAGGDLVERVDRTLGLGPAIRLRWDQNPTGGAVPSQTLTYVLRLADGRTLVLTTISVAEDTGFEALAERIVATFSLTP